MRVIETIVSKARKAPPGYSRIGDDVALVPQGKGRVVMKVDMLVEGTDVPRGMSYRDAARKAVAMCVSDFAAKGVRPDSFMVSLGLKKGVTDEEVEDIALGLKDAGRKWGVRLVGGDTNQARELVVDCAMVGFARGIVERRGASPGDALVVTGPFGYTSAGLRILTSSVASEKRFAAKAKRSVLKPTPDLEVGLALAPYLTSGMDSSDGLARSIHTLAKESGVGFDVGSLPAAPGVEKFALMNGLNAESLVLEGGEEYVVVGTVRSFRLASARRAVRRAGGELLEIGAATPYKGRVVLRSQGRSGPIANVGWTHLR